jgi:hypothetical protein
MTQVTMVITAQMCDRLPLNQGRAAFREGLDLRQLGHGHIARERRGQGAMGPPQTDDLIQLPSVQHSVDQTEGEAVATADAIDDTQLAGRRDRPLDLTGLPRVFASANSFRSLIIDASQTLPTDARIWVTEYNLYENLGERNHRIV